MLEWISGKASCHWHSIHDGLLFTNRASAAKAIVGTSLYVIGWLCCPFRRFFGSRKEVIGHVERFTSTRDLLHPSFIFSVALLSPSLELF